MLLSAFWRLARASSTSASGEGSPRQCTDSSIALCMTVPRAVGGDHSNGSERSAHGLSLASEHLRERELAQEEGVVVEGVGSDVLHQRLQTVLEPGSQLVAQARFELGSSPLRGSEQAHHLLLGRV